MATGQSRVVELPKRDLTQRHVGPKVVVTTRERIAQGVARPLEDLAAALASRSLPPERFPALRPGEVRTLA